MARYTTTTTFCDRENPTMLTEGQRKLLDKGKDDVRYFIGCYEKVRLHFGRSEAQYCYRFNQGERAGYAYDRLKKTVQWCKARGIYHRADFAFGSPVIQNRPPADYSGKRAKTARAVLAIVRGQS